MKIILLLLSISILSASGQKKSMSIPFKLTKYNNISVQAVLNKTDTVTLMLHTAASSVTLIESAVSKIKSLTFTDTDTVKSWGGKNAARFSENNSLQIGKFQFNNISIWENKYSGQETDGKFGLDLFKDKYVKLDFRNRVLVISTALPGNIKNFEKHKLIVENDMMFLKAVITVQDTSMENNFLIHSGYSGSILLDDQFVSTCKLDDRLKKTGEKNLQDSYGNTIKTIEAVIPEFNIGTIKLFEVPVGFFPGSLGIQKMSVIGGNILKKFIIIIDPKREYIYLIPNNRNV